MEHKSRFILIVFKFPATARATRRAWHLAQREMKRQGTSCQDEGSAHRPLALALNSLGGRKGGLVASASGG